jgi:AhpD family alkylhydroperoxidase
MRSSLAVSRKADYRIDAPASDFLHTCRRAPRTGAIPKGNAMALVPIVEYEGAPAEVRAVYDDIMATRRTDWINNFWKTLASDPATLRRTWAMVKEVMAPGALDPLVKEMVYVAVSATNNCEYCIASHTAAARAKGMTPGMHAELMAVVALANATNRLANGYRIDVDERFRVPAP